MNIRLSLLAAAVLLPAGCGEPGPERTETARLHAWLDDEYQTELDFSPLARTRLGDRRGYGELDDVSERALDRRLAWRRDSVARMRREFDRERLDEEGRLSWDLWERRLDSAERALPFRRHRYIFGRGGPQTGLPNSLINFHDVDSAADMEAYVSRLKQSGRYLAQYLERARLAAADGIRAPYFDYDQAISEIRRVTSGEPFGGDGVSALWRDVRAKLDGLRERGLAAGDEAARLEREARAAMLNELAPAYAEALAWLEADRANAPEPAAGARALPDGAAWYAERLRAMTTLPMTAGEIHALGLREVARIQEEMEGIRRRVGFEGGLREFFAFLREDDRFYFPDTDQGRADYLATAEGILDRMHERLPDYFGILPKAGLEVRRVEAFRETPGGAAHYMRGTADGTRPGVFYAHLADMRAAAANRLENLSYHEGVPGHHLQLSIQQELEHLPAFRADGGFSAYSEGWGLYAELLGKEMGGYADPYADMGRLSGEIWRAVRLVVDTGIHALGWSEERAARYALDNSPRPEPSVRSEVRRYFNNPGQAVAYKVGMIKILEYRARAEAELGEAFDIRAFHDAVLGSGPLPLPMLEAKIDRWIASVGR